MLDTIVTAQRALGLQPQVQYKHIPILKQQFIFIQGQRVLRYVYVLKDRYPKEGVIILRKKFYLVQEFHSLTNGRGFKIVRELKAEELDRDLEQFSMFAKALFDLRYQENLHATTR